MSLFVMGLGFTLAAPLLCRERYATNGSHWIYSVGCSMGVLGPYFLACTFLDTTSILLCSTLLGFPVWCMERWRIAARKPRLTSGVIAFAVELMPFAFALLLIRALVVEPFVVPSSSMRPTLAVGNVVIVDKFTYGIHVPFVDAAVSDGRTPARGEVLVFRFPLDHTKPYIKRVIGIPGDRIAYRNGRLIVNGQEQSPTYFNTYSYVDEETGLTTEADEQSDSIGQIYFHSLKDAVNKEIGRGADFPPINGCSRDDQGISCVVPPDAYFVLGDNRANSLDSRYWGFVPSHLIIGRAVYSLHIANWRSAVTKLY